MSAKTFAEHLAEHQRRHAQELFDITMRRTETLRRLMPPPPPTRWQRLKAWVRHAYRAQVMRGIAVLVIVVAFGAIVAKVWFQ